MLRRKYEGLDAKHQGGMPDADRSLQQLSTEEMAYAFQLNEMDPQRWPTVSLFDAYLKNICQLRHFKVPVGID